ncbi:hypothetical protein NDU88_007152 [Pleurodeles waltl]|uniref:Uncharacterized protein n=1 Tax=Pleurodeles waltl TaxID=8319 RepID=A0AAV7RU33_PLEWA|nr:hypothetical protein NDU88_007152 [Pleurodeles waltl]
MPSALLALPGSGPGSVAHPLVLHNCNLLPSIGPHVLYHQRAPPPGFTIICGVGASASLLNVSLPSPQWRSGPEFRACRLSVLAGGPCFWRGPQPPCWLPVLPRLLRASGGGSCGCSASTDLQPHEP